MERGGQSYFYHTDGLGSITQITDSSKQIVASYGYDAFGNMTSKAGSLTNPYTFTSREYDPESELYYYRARYYDPKIGRFLQPDPLDMAMVILFRQYFPGNPISGLLYQYALRNPMFISNMYLYCLNNAINIIDPEGLHGFILIGRGPILIGKEPYIFRPLHLRYPMPRYVPRPLPKTIPRPILRPVLNHLLKLLSPSLCHGGILFYDL